MSTGLGHDVVPWVCSIAVLLIAGAMISHYACLNSSYDTGREQIHCDTSFRILYKVLILGAVIITLASYWTTSPVLLLLNDSSLARTAGLATGVLGFAMFEWAVRSLGAQYSPCFDLRMPTQRIRSGAYRYLPHPMYVGNTFILGGAAVSSGSF